MSETVGSHFQFEIPHLKEDASVITNTALQLAAIAEQLALEERTLVAHKDGRAENVAEHTHMLTLIAPVVAEEFFPQLDANLVARYAAVHDVVEAYVGDTATHEITAEGMTMKEQLEKRGLEQLTAEYEHLPSFVRLIQAYEQQQIPEARFVRMVDKWMPLLLHFQNEGKVLREHIDREGLLKNSQQRTEQWKQEYPDFIELIQVREELAELAAKELLEE